MRRLAVVASFALAFFVVVLTAGGRPAVHARPAALHTPMATPAARSGRPGCRRTFTKAQAERAARRTYAGIRDVSSRERRRLSWMQDCQRLRLNEPKVAAFYRKERRSWQLRRNPPLSGPVTASWYDDGGGTGCGFHATNGIAALNVPCGARVLLVHNGHRVVAVRDDSGPYVGGRLFDLNRTVKGALACSDLCSVMWRRI